MSPAPYAKGPATDVPLSWTYALPAVSSHQPKSIEPSPSSVAGSALSPTISAASACSGSNPHIAPPVKLSRETAEASPQTSVPVILVTVRPSMKQFARLTSVKPPSEPVPIVTSGASWSR